MILTILLDERPDLLPLRVAQRDAMHRLVRQTGSKMAVAGHRAGVGRGLSGLLGRDDDRGSQRSAKRQGKKNASFIHALTIA